MVLRVISDKGAVSKKSLKFAAGRLSAVNTVKSGTI